MEGAPGQSPGAPRGDLKDLSEGQESRGGGGRSLLQLVLRVCKRTVAPPRTAPLLTEVPTHAGLVLAVGLRLKGRDRIPRLARLARLDRLACLACLDRLARLDRLDRLGPGLNEAWKNRWQPFLLMFDLFY